MKSSSLSHSNCKLTTLVLAVPACLGSPVDHAAPGSSQVQPAQVIESFEGAFGVHPGQRRNHTKGVCATGEFVGTSAAAALSRSALFSGHPIPVIARFSVGGGNPDVADVESSLPRGMALELHLPRNALQHMAMVNIPVFGAATPATFNEQLIAARPDPKTGKPDPQKLHDFFATHPDTQPLAEWSRQHRPSASYYQSTYFSIHTFRFLDAQGGEHLVKWRFIPRDGDKELTAAEIASAPHDFLESGLIDRLKKGPAKWDMVVYVGEPGDPVDNPSLPWPESRAHLVAGTLTIVQATPQHGAACEKINFDPLILADGIGPTNDPVLLFRSPAYAISFSKRLSGR